MLLACTASQKVYGVGQHNANAFYSGTGDSPSEACRNFSIAYGGYYESATEFSCNSSLLTTEHPIIKLCDDSPQFTADKIADMSLLWGAFLLAAIVIFLLRKLLNIFESPPHGE